MIERKILKEIEKYLFKGKALLIFGARQVGKTTLLQQIRKKYGGKTLYLNCDEPDDRNSLTDKTSTQLKDLVGNNKLILIDEAQRVRNIGITIKLFVDQLHDKQIIATGSSSFDLSNDIFEPLTGRILEFELFPFSINELAKEYGWADVNRLLEQRLIYGMYPEIVLNTDIREKLLKNISQSYLFKDILTYQQIRKSSAIEKLVTALSLQIGNQVSYHELSNLCRLDNETIEKYIDILEKAFIIFRLPPFSGNLRSEIAKMRKIYFYDTGIRNALISNFNSLDYRQDTGALWENFIISERLKFLRNNDIDAKSYFWRTHQRQEIDYVEELSGTLTAAEVKWNINARKKIPKKFIEAYHPEKTMLITPENYRTFLE